VKCQGINDHHGILPVVRALMQASQQNHRNKHKCRNRQSSVYGSWEDIRETKGFCHDRLLEFLSAMLGARCIWGRPVSLRGRNRYIYFSLPQLALIMRAVDGSRTHRRRRRRRDKRTASRRGGERGCSSLISRIARFLELPLCFTVHPAISRHGQAAACPRAVQKSATYRSLRLLQWQPWCRRQAH
jgi:hypothetical protein